MVDYFQRLFEYDGWANCQFVSSLHSLNEPPAACVRLLGHILSAERLWLERLREDTQTLPVWPEFTLEHCKVQADELPGRWREYLASLSDASLDQSVNYKNSKGEYWNNRVGDILQHVVTHATYHRGQIASHMRGTGFAPPYTDFIHAVRQDLLK